MKWNMEPNLWMMVVEHNTIDPFCICDSLNQIDSITNTALFNNDCGDESSPLKLRRIKCKEWKMTEEMKQFSFVVFLLFILTSYILADRLAGGNKGQKAKVELFSYEIIIAFIIIPSTSFLLVHSRRKYISKVNSFPLREIFLIVLSLSHCLLKLTSVFLAFHFG